MKSFSICRMNALLRGQAFGAAGALVWRLSDMIVAGNIVGVDALAGIAATIPVFIGAQFLAKMVYCGAGYLFAKRQGEFAPEKAREVVGTAMETAVVVGALTFLAMFFGRDLTGSEDDYDSMMIMFAGAIPFGDFKLTGQVFAGENLGGIQAGIGQTVGFDPVTGRGRGVRTVGGFIDLAYQLTPDWSLAIGYGFDNPDDGDAKFDGQRTFNDRAYIDAFYQVTTNFKIGIEYARLNTRYCDAPDGTRGGNAYADRFQFSAYYDF